MMLQNEVEMYHLGIAENARYCNGHARVADGMAPKKEHKIKRSKMVPSKDDIPSPTSLLVDGKVKFSDKLKALLKTGGALKSEPDIDDPYAFSEPEPQALRLYKKSGTNNSYPGKCGASNSRLCQVTAKSGKASMGNVGDTNCEVEKAKMARLFPALSSPVKEQLAAENFVVENKVPKEESSKTMNKLQAKIAQNKVIGKHKKVHSSSPCSDAVLSARKRERSLLEEQLLGISPDVPVKKESGGTSSTWHKAQAHNCSAQPTVVMLPSKRQQRRPLPKLLAGTLDEKLQRVRIAHNALLDYKQDLFPLGVEISDSEESDLEEETSIFQRHWFSGCGELGMGDGESQREGRLAQLRCEMRRKLRQMCMGMPVHHANLLVGALVQSARTHPSQSALLLQAEKRSWRPPKHNRSKLTMLVKRVCSYRKGESDACSSLALPCTQHCVRHIMYNVDQILFEHCTAKFSDNTQCCVPVFDVCHELPLCLEHARKRDNYDRMCAETKPKKVRKKAKPSAMTRPSKRGKKKRRANRLSEQCVMENSNSQQVDTPGDCSNLRYEPSSETDQNGGETSSPSETFEPYIKEEMVENMATPETHIIPEPEPSVTGVQVVEEEVVLGMAEELPLDPVELANQASRLLEEHDLTNVLNQIPADAFNDLFTEDKNGEYEPTREETEELERALEAVDKDVKSLEKLSQTQGLLDTLTDEHALLQTLAQLPEVPALSVPGIVPVFTSYHNGFVVNSHSSTTVDNKNMVAHSSESPSVLSFPTISIQTQTDMPS